jgi:hypothetical protein
MKQVHSAGVSLLIAFARLHSEFSKIEAQHDQCRLPGMKMGDSIGLLVGNLLRSS